MDSGSAVYGVALNFRAEYENFEPRMHGDPYKKPPVAPILYLKPRNTWIGPGDSIPFPSDAEELKMSGTLGVVVGRTACRVREEDALDYIGGYAVVNDVSIPHDSYYRPAIRERCRDGFCPVGELGDLDDPAKAEIRITVNDEMVFAASTSELVRPVARLIADITEFMTLRAGDLLLVGEPFGAPLARSSDRIRIEINGLAPLENRVGRR